MGELGLGDGHVIPGVSVSGGYGHGDLFAAAADENLGAFLGLGFADGLVDREVLTFEGGLLFGPHALHDFDHFFEGTEAFARTGELTAGLLELRREPAGAESGDDAAGGDLVDGRDLLGEDRGVSEKGRRYEGAELCLLRNRGDRGE